jgi:hypothetical protein
MVTENYSRSVPNLKITQFRGSGTLLKNSFAICEDANCMSDRCKLRNASINKRHRLAGQKTSSIQMDGASLHGVRRCGGNQFHGLSMLAAIGGRGAY